MVSLLALRYFEGCPQAMGIWWLVVVRVSGHFFLSFFLGFTIVQQQHIANFNFKWKKKLQNVIYGLFSTVISNLSLILFSASY